MFTVLDMESLNVMSLSTQFAVTTPTWRPVWN